jgi:murein L,D-transpeptidase YcbB/YkuD
MRNARFDHLLTGAAVALALAVIGYAPGAHAQSKVSVEAAMPSPDTSGFPAPTVEEITATPTAATPAAATPAAATPASATPVAATPAAGSPAGMATNAVATESKPAAPAVSLADAAVADRLRELPSGKFDRIVGGKKDRGSIEPFYSDRNFAPLWITDGALNARAKVAAAYIAGIGADGLEPSDYPLPRVTAGAEPDALAEAELRFTDSVITYARHAQIGRVHYSRVAGDILYDLARPEPGDVLTKLAKADNIGEALDSYNPQQPGYKALKAKLAEVRHGPPKNEAKAEPEPIQVPEGIVLRPGMSDPRVVALRKRLDIAGDQDNDLYDDAVAEAVKAYQMSANIGVDGLLGPNTVRTLNGKKTVQRPLADPTDTILANMERWRWMPRDLGKVYVMVNIPDYSLRVVRDGKLYWKTKVVVGKPNLATPITSAEMKFITVNPTWNVPPSIIQNEYLPALQQDPQAMERIGLKVSQNPDGTVRIWQPPGDRNALGRIRFNFPNKFLVYQHDTPDKHLFAHDKPAYSHGCMRVEDPLKYGEVLLSIVRPGEGYTQERLRKMFGGGEININFPNNIPVHLTYQTAYVDDAGKLVIRDDVYGRDARTLAALKGDQRKVADIPIERPRNNSSAPVRMPPGSFGGGSFGGGLFSGPSFFERLFGGPEVSPPPRPRSRVGRANDRGSVR